MTEIEKLDLRSHNVAADKVAELRRRLTEARTEGGNFDFDRLRLALGETVDVGTGRLQLSWPGTADCLKTIQQPSTGTVLRSTFLPPRVRTGGGELGLAWLVPWVPYLLVGQRRSRLPAAPGVRLVPIRVPDRLRSEAVPAAMVLASIRGACPRSPLWRLRVCFSLYERRRYHPRE